MQPGGLGEFIRTRRLEIGISSQEKLAEIAGVGQKKVSQMEANANFRSPLPPPDIFSAVATALRVRQSDLLREAGYLTDDTARRLDDRSDAWQAEQDATGITLGHDEIQRRADVAGDAVREATRRAVIEAFTPESRGDSRQTSFGQ